MSPFALLLLQILPYLPAVVHSVEELIGPKKGQEKLNTAVGLLSTVVPAVITHLEAEPANKQQLESLISTVVTGLNAANAWKKAGVDEVSAP